MNSLLSSPQVKCRDPISLQEKLSIIQKAGPEELLVLSDFDYTISKAFDQNGRRSWPTLGVFEVILDQMKPGLSEELENVWTRYLPIELDPNLPNEEKTPHMIECWTQIHNIICSAGFTKDFLRESTLSSGIELRDSFKKWLKFLADNAIPLTIFSTGCGDVIEVILEKELGKVPPNVSIIANFLEFDEMRKVAHFKEPIIHVFNKNTSVIQKGSPFWTAHSNRKNILLMGDNLGDLHIGGGQEHLGTTLKIGFLNTYSEASESSYIEGFDIVLIEDQSMKIPFLMTNFCFSQKIL